MTFHFPVLICGNNPCDAAAVLARIVQCYLWRSLSLGLFVLYPLQGTFLSYLALTPKGHGKARVLLG